MISGCLLPRKRWNVLSSEMPCMHPISGNFFTSRLNLLAPVSQIFFVLESTACWSWITKPVALSFVWSSQWRLRINPALARILFVSTAQRLCLCLLNRNFPVNLTLVSILVHVLVSGHTSRWWDETWCASIVKGAGTRQLPCGRLWCHRLDSHLFAVYYYNWIFLNPAECVNLIHVLYILYYSRLWFNLTTHVLTHLLCTNPVLCDSDSSEHLTWMNTSEEMGQGEDTSTHVTFNVLNSTLAPRLLRSLQIRGHKYGDGNKNLQMFGYH